ncbi:hypothetical protein KC333_g9266 [Hortaea werneckii]|nr:hypothetical protein KC333_g9266 [Hortaea werneckii]KAI7300959.1 hypothetical protein KC326_g9244 [Hortaea werneckii]
MVSREPGSTVTDEETGVQEKTPRRKPPSAKQPYEERTDGSFGLELNLNCLHGLTVEDYAYEIESHMRFRPTFETTSPIATHKSTYIRVGQVITHGTQLPPLTTRFRNLYFSEDEEKRYFQIANQCGSETETDFNFRQYMKRHRKNGLAHHLWDLKHSGGLNPADKDVWAYESDFEVVEQYFWGAPKLRKAVQHAWTHMNMAGQHDRVIKLFQCPQSCDDIGPIKRQEIINKFNNPNEDWEVLLMEHAMHQLCHKVIVIEQAANKATEDNATMRIRRLGQTHPQEVDQYIMRRTYMLMREKAMMQKFDGVVRLQFKLLDGAPNANNVASTAFGATAFCFGAFDEQSAEWGIDKVVYGQQQ